MEQKKLLYVEDETIIRNNFSEFFLTSGFNVFSVDSEDRAKQLISAHADFDCAIFDVELGGNPFAGIELCRKFREKFPLIPVLILSAYTDTDLQEMSYKLGADAYVDKREPLSLLGARLDTLLSRYEQLLNGGDGGSDVSNKTLTSEALVIDLQRGRAEWLGTELNLNPIRLAILDVLYRARGKSVSVHVLQQSLNIVVESNTVVQHIKIIREEFTRVDPVFNCIRTVRGKGYRWVSPVR